MLQRIKGKIILAQKHSPNDLAGLRDIAIYGFGQECILLLVRMTALKKLAVLVFQKGSSYIGEWKEVPRVEYIGDYTRIGNRYFITVK